MDAKEQITDAYRSNDMMARAYWAIIDQDEQEVRDHPEIKVTFEEQDDDLDPDTDTAEIRSVEYDASGPLMWPNESQEETRTALENWPSEVTVGWGRPLTILLAGGGPTEWIEATYDSDGDVSEATLYASAGSESREWSLSRTSALYRLAEYFAEMNQQPKQQEQY